MGNDAVPRKLGFIGGIEGLRAVAIFMVMLHHLSIRPHWFDGGRGGVDVFFVISGFLISALLVNEFDRDGGLDLKRFYTRRAFRLLPAVLVMLGAVLVYATVRAKLHHDPVPTGLFKQACWAVLYVANWTQAFGKFAFAPLIHLWSLSVEEQFYFLAPLALVFTLPRFTRPRILTGLVAIGAIGVLWRGVLVANDVSKFRIRFGLDTHADGLILGCVLGIAFASGLFPKQFGPSRAKELLGPASLVVLVAITVFQQPWRYDEFVAPALHAAVGGVAIWSVIGQERGVHLKLLNLAPVRRLGKVSYGMYLWHLPVELYSWAALGNDKPLWLRTIVAWTIAYGLAEASFWLVETPLMNLVKTRRVPQRQGGPHDSVSASA
jgi:peptidoglycan/LPS O-acetylase OafA/YrhL